MSDVSVTGSSVGDESNRQTVTAGVGANIPKEPIEIDFLNLGDGKFAELIEDPTDRSRTRLALWENSTIQYVDKLEHAGQIFVPLERNELMAGIRLPRAACPPGSLQKLMGSVEDLIRQCISIHAKYVPVLAAFVLATWFTDRFVIAPYVSIVGLSQAGKTTLLQLLELLCRRGWLVGEISPASLYRACTRFGPTVLIDDLSTKDRRLRHILRTGATRSLLSVQANHCFHGFGPKVISWVEAADDTQLNSRCILVPMFESKRTDLAKLSDPEIQVAAAALQTQLLYHRLQVFNEVEVLPMKGDGELRPRTRDLLRVLCAATIQDQERCQVLFKFFISGNAVPLEPLSVEQNAVLVTLFALIHSTENVGSLRTNDLTRNVNHCLRLSGEKRSLEPRKVGSVLTSLGFCNRTRGNSGWCVYFHQEDIKKIHDLAENYGLDRVSQQLMESLFGAGHKFIPENCSLCQGAVRKETASIPPVGEHAPIQLSRKAS